MAFKLFVKNLSGQKVWIRFANPSCFAGRWGVGGAKAPLEPCFGNADFQVFNLAAGLPPGDDDRQVLTFWKPSTEPYGSHDCTGDNGHFEVLATYGRVTDAIPSESRFRIAYASDGLLPLQQPKTFSADVETRDVDGITELHWTLHDAYRVRTPLPEGVEETLRALEPVLGKVQTKKTDTPAAVLQAGCIPFGFSIHPDTDPLGLLAEWQTREHTGPPLVTGIDEPFAKGARKPQWYELLEHPVPPPQPGDGGFTHSKWWDGIFNVLTLAAFSLGGGTGAVAAAGVATVGLLPRLLGAPPQATASTYDWVLDLKRTVSTEIQQAIVQGEQAHIFSHFQNFSDNVNGFLQEHWTKSLDDGVLERIREYVDAILDVSVTGPMFTYMLEGGPPPPRTPDLDPYPSFQAESLVLFVQSFSLWLWAAKLGVLLYSGEELTVQSLTDRMKEGLTSSNLKSTKSQGILSDAIQKIDRFTDGVRDKDGKVVIKGVKDVLDDMEHAIAARLGGIRITDGGFHERSGSEDLGPVGPGGAWGGAVRNWDERTIFLSVRDGKIESEGVADKTGGALVPYTLGLDRKHAVAQAVAQSEDPLFLTSAFAAPVFADGRAWVCHVGRTYARRWGYTQTDSDGSTHSIRPHVEKVLAKWQEIRDLFDDLQYEAKR